MKYLILLAVLGLAGCASPTTTSTDKTTPPVVTDKPTSGQALGYKAVDTSGHAYYVFLNAGTVAKTFTADTDLSAAVVVVDKTSAGTKAIASPVGVQVSGRVVTVAAGTSAVLRL